MVRTKLRPPVLRDDVIVRQRLLDKLREALLSHQLTLISAPAGCGKTTLMASLPHAYPDLPLTWISLDADDNDPAQFLRVLIAALRRLDPACGVDAETLLSRLDHTGTDARRIIGVLINEIVETITEPFVLVLDDLHVITEPGVHAALGYLLERLPPQMHLAVATRRDPPLALARLRARRQLAELRLADLSFTPEETDRLFNGALNLDVSAEHLALLQDHTEGWAAGIGLLVGSLDGGPGPTGRDALLARLGQTDRHVFEFLAEEVLDRQEQDIRDFLLKTSVLTELTPELCAALTGRDDVPAVLEEMYRRNLFVVAIDGSGATFRYHDLFKEFLLQRLEREMPETVRGLHRLAAEAETVPSRAVRHYLAAQMWAEAADVVEQVGDQLLRQGSFDTVQGWIQSLPEEVREARPGLAWLLGKSAWMKANSADARRFMEMALKGFEAAGDEARRGEALVYLATCLGALARFEEAEEALQHALDHPLAPHDRAQALLEHAYQELRKGNWVQANADIDAAFALAETPQDLRVPYAFVDSWTSAFTVLPGGVERTERLCSLIRERLGDEIGPAQAQLQLGIALVNLWRGRWAEAQEACERVLAIGARFGGLPWEETEADEVLAVCCAIRGDHATSDRHFDALFRKTEEPSVAPFSEPWRAIFLYDLGRVRWLQGRLEEAREVYGRMRAIKGARELRIAPVVRAMMEGLLSLSDRRYADAESSLRRAAELQHKIRFSVSSGNADLLLAHLYRLQDRPEAALAEMEPVLAEHERHDTPGFILWEGPIMVPLLRLAVERGVHGGFAARVLELFDAQQGERPARVPETGEILTPREVEILRLISAGATNRQIAEQLVVSIHTVKIHVAHILRKLGVSSRTHAAARARELGVL